MSTKMVQLPDKDVECIDAGAIAATLGLTILAKLSYKVRS